jgi:hypothetical protein
MQLEEEKEEYIKCRKLDTPMMCMEALWVSIGP